MALTRAKTRLQPRTSPRRSARLNGANDVTESLRSRTKKSIKRNAQLAREVGQNTSGSSRECHASSHRTLLHQERDLSQRKNDIIEAEQAISAQWELLDKREEELVNTQRRREAQSALTQLEEHFQCPLCYEIMAHPYTLTPAECGHTFCAICTLKWFFSRLHRGCGSWHESVDCPICRSLLILTPDVTPRTVVTVPFTPNRLAGNVIKNLVTKLEGGWGLAGSSGKDSGRSSSKSSVCKRPNGCGGKRVKSESRTPNLVGYEADGKPALESWAAGGELWKDWLERDQRGRTEMEDIIGRWCQLTTNDFIAIKLRLGV